jgi:hypothetical protein
MSTTTRRSPAPTVPPPPSPDTDDSSDLSAPTSVSWPAGPLAAAQRAFDLLTRPPAPLAFDCRGYDALPQRIIALDELARLLIARSTPPETRDLVWSQLVTRARRDGPAWMVAAVGIALPALRFRAGLLTRGWHGDVSDLDSELLLGFLERLKTIDLDAGNIGPRLVDSGARAVKRAREQSERTEPVSSDGPQSIPPTRWWDHPDLVLARAVAAAVIGPEEHLLIAQTRLEDIPLREVADHLGISAATAISWRWTAEQRLREAIQAGDLHWVNLSAGARGRSQQRVPPTSAPQVPPPAGLAGAAGAPRCSPGQAASAAGRPRRLRERR